MKKRSKLKKVGTIKGTLKDIGLQIIFLTEGKTILKVSTHRILEKLKPYFDKKIEAEAEILYSTMGHPYRVRINKITKPEEVKISEKRIY